MSTPKLRIAYVPEHFASPLLQLAAKDSSIELVPCPSASRSSSLDSPTLPPEHADEMRPAELSAGGTGQIMSAIKAGEVDLAIALTEARHATLNLLPSSPRPRG